MFKQIKDKLEYIYREMERNSNRKTNLIEKEQSRTCRSKTYNN